MGLMDQAAVLSNETGTDGVAEKPRDRPILSISTPSPKSVDPVSASGSASIPESPADGRPAAVEVASSAQTGEPIDAAPPVEPSVTPEVVTTEPVASAPEVSPAEATPVVESTPVDPEAAVRPQTSAEVSVDPVVEPSKVDSPTASTEDAEHEGVEIARKAREGEESTVPVQGAGEDLDPKDPADPVSAAIAAAAAGSDPADPAAGGVSTDVVESESGEKVPPKTQMDYHEALSHINRTAARRGHVDIDDRISEYVRTNRREALDRPAPLTVKRELRAIKNGTVDEKLLEARKVVSGGIDSKDISIQVAIDQMEARRGKGDDEIKALTKGPASKEEIDPATLAAAATRGRTAPGL